MPGVVGTSIPRVDAKSKVTGEALYASDYYLPGMLHLKLVRSTQAHAKISKIDIGAFTNLQDAYCFTAKDIEVNNFGQIVKDQPVLAEERVRFFGEPIAVVAAKTSTLASEYAQLVHIDYETVDVVKEPEEAIQAGSPLIHGQGNLLQHIPFYKGDTERAFAGSHLTLEDTFTVPVVDHLYLEPESGVSFLDENGVLNIIAGTQNPFYDQQEIARCLDIPQEKIRVRTPNIGGGFGGKDGNTVQLFLALVTWKTGLPARLVFTREESLMASYKRHAAKVKVRLGFTKEGLITAYQGKVYYDTGAYAALGPAVVGLGVEHAAGPYVIPNVQIDGYLCYTNKPPASAMRGFGAPQTAFATETLLNRAAKQLQLDPVQLRIKNALYKGAEGSLGQPMNHSVGLREALQILEKSDLWQERLYNEEPNIGYGMAAGFLSCGMGKGIKDTAKVEIERLPGGFYEIKIGTVEIGQGSTTAFVQLAAQALGVSPEKIQIVMGDTGLTHDSGSTAASRTTYISGNALLAAVADLQRQAETGQKGIGEAVFPEVSQPDLGIGLPHCMYTFIAQAAKVKVNPLTGEVQLLQVFAVTEAGQIINPMALEGQIQGGVAMGVGYTLLEQMDFTHGVPNQTNLSTYLIPTSLDLADMETATVNEYEDSGPMGLKGAAEVGTVAIAPAITAAINEVVDISINELPVSRERIAQ
ncbi:xanthine dehydrogenase, molybdenum binding subunit apoprotein [Desulforamulus reducens MI-1]|uniref:Xanthine dehydrogenase, molybdenum binding subunit apoprotein n=1 Tax=Desulforamulus reducens (strain ATCC BAA-1160 / DSM 100696 / MI-1) TaxID=349161 RepID=A4J871_DESRM|nr:xanthine dehydrogenase family protein molybdopterin-binding subunit [Desulforamulus reducens]ABO51274.1 xanthine dehydrogenase, molybdenum binding subunit apoprotein [Desulforamulus reducens MI-1]